MSDNTLLSKVKATLLIKGKFHDEMLSNYINEVVCFLKSAGVKTAKDTESAIAGVVAKGVSDLWTQGKLSDYFYQRAMQLKIEDSDNVQTEH